MVQLKQRGSTDPLKFDLTFMYTERCDLDCPFCMYESGPDVQGVLDLDLLEKWLRTMNYDRIASFGAYGGEVSVDYDGWTKCFEMVRRECKPHFVITNGSWSTDPDKTSEFMKWAIMNRCHIVVSGTPYHRRFQDREVLERIKSISPEHVTLKPKEENFHAMRRLEGKMKFSCSRKCMWWSRALRLAIKPDGSIIFQNCDGVYPTVGGIWEPWTVIEQRIRLLRASGFDVRCPHYNSEAARLGFEQSGEVEWAKSHLHGQR